MIWNFFVSAVPHLDIEFLTFVARTWHMPWISWDKPWCLRLWRRQSCVPSWWVWWRDRPCGHAVGNETTSGLAGKPNYVAPCGLKWTWIIGWACKGLYRCYKQEARTRLLDRLPSCCVMLRSRTSTASRTLTAGSPYVCAANQRVSGDRRCA